MDGKRLKHARLTRKMTLQELADKIGVSSVTVSRWESGVNEPDDAKKQFLSELLDVPLLFLMGEKESSKIEVRDGEFILAPYAIILDMAHHDANKMTSDNRNRASTMLYRAILTLERGDSVIFDETGKRPPRPMPSEPFADFIFDPEPYEKIFDVAFKDNTLVYKGIVDREYVGIAITLLKRALCELLTVDPQGSIN